jgi:1,4-alpha-glucan branching enzyme
MAARTPSPKAAGATDTDSVRKSATKPVRILVELPQAEEVGVTGDFTNWNLDGTPLHHGAEGLWYTTLELAPGTYQYRLRVDGEWRDDPHAQKRVPNPFGSENCVLVVE